MAPDNSYALLLVFPLAAIVGLMLWLPHRHALTSNGGSACGQCGYSAVGATPFACPECGADLREAGIRRIPPRQLLWRRLGYGLMLGGGAMTLLAAGPLIAWLLSSSPRMVPPGPIIVSPPATGQPPPASPNPQGTTTTTQNHSPVAPPPAEPAPLAP